MHSGRWYQFRSINTQAEKAFGRLVAYCLLGAAVGALVDFCCTVYWFGQGWMMHTSLETNWRQGLLAGVAAGCIRWIIRRQNVRFIVVSTVVVAKSQIAFRFLRGTPEQKAGLDKTVLLTWLRLGASYVFLTSFLVSLLIVYLPFAFKDSSDKEVYPAETSAEGS